MLHAGFNYNGYLISVYNFLKFIATVILFNQAMVFFAVTGKQKPTVLSKKII